MSSDRGEPPYTSPEPHPQQPSPGPVPYQAAPPSQAPQPWQQAPPPAQPLQQWHQPPPPTGQQSTASPSPQQPTQEPRPKQMPPTAQPAGTPEGALQPGRPQLRPVTIEEIVQTDVGTAERDTPNQTVAAEMAERDVGSVVVIEEDVPVGILTDRRIALSLESSPDVSDRQADDLVTQNSSPGPSR